MNHAELKLLFNSLENNRERLTKLQYEFILSLKAQYGLTGLLTPWQIESLVTIKEKVQALEDNAVPEPDFVSSLYSQLQEFSYIRY
jgi:hypothetical protein